MTIALHYQHHGQGQPLIILHGLFGTLENWGQQIKAFAGSFSVYSVDLRNHGRSPHCETMDYPSMARDVIDLMDNLHIKSAHVLGHSMGGKVAMQMALNHPDRINRLIVVDISPVDYPAHHEAVFKGLFAVELSSIRSRGEAETQLGEHVQDPGVRQFLLKNLYRKEGHFEWRMNLNAIYREYASIGKAPSGKQPFQGDTLFIKGKESDYIQPGHRKDILTRFPRAHSKLIEGAGHWPHAEKPKVFTSLVMKFLVGAG